uniref:Uncharacterized protein n=1 Tax=Oryza brachyantha TaxID=4533 RepID=J3L7M9_ORYBR
MNTCNANPRRMARALGLAGKIAGRECLQENIPYVNVNSLWKCTEKSPLLHCSGCSRHVHPGCLTPPWTGILTDDWSCCTCNKLEGEENEQDAHVADFSQRVPDWSWNNCRSFGERLSPQAGLATEAVWECEELKRQGFLSIDRLQIYALSL